jgi:Flp pilus assembly protein TadD
MAVRTSDFVVCPACNSRNNPKRELCGRCGESLQDATLTTAPLFPSDAEPEAEAPAPGGTGLFLDLVGLAAALVILAVGWKVARGAPSTASPALFTLATQQARPAPPVTIPEVPGGRDFEEGRLLLSRGDASKAIGLLSRAVSAAPSNALFHEVLGQAFWAVGSRDQALAHYGEAARLDRRQFGLRLAEHLALAGRDADAARAYGQLLSVNADDPVAQESLAHALYRLGDYGNAVPVLQRVVRVRPDDPVLRQELGYALQATGDVAGAVDAYRSVLAQIPGADVARGLLAGLLYEQGKEEEAIALAREGIALNPGAPLLRLHLANMLERSGRPAEAAPEYREYARLLPLAPDAKELEERADRLQGSSGGS